MSIKKSKKWSWHSSRLNFEANTTCSHSSASKHFQHKATFSIYLNTHEHRSKDRRREPASKTVSNIHKITQKTCKKHSFTQLFQSQNHIVHQTQLFTQISSHKPTSIFIQSQSIIQQDRSIKTPHIQTNSSNDPHISTTYETVSKSSRSIPSPDHSTGSKQSKVKGSISLPLDLGSVNFVSGILRWDS